MTFVRPAWLVAVAACLLLPARTATAGSLEVCAQRVIRDWYSGGRVDHAYPLPCYRAAIRALPEDVLHYSNADRDIARALAYARQGRNESNDARPAREEPASRPASPRQAQTERIAGARPAPPGRIVRDPDLPVRLASSPEREAMSASLPYPVIVLAVLSGVLLLTGGVGWLTARGR